jgi:hypothetical protein|tara:strand:+ start:77 stop:247 length:171 start_codon:yes stop_codon:yes gene_type:complete
VLLLVCVINAVVVLNVVVRLVLKEVVVLLLSAVALDVIVPNVVVREVVVLLDVVVT